jgi:hypothetical protein
LNFTQENKIQKNFSPLYLKRIPVNWKSDILKQLPRFLPPHPTLSLKGRGIKGEGEKNLIDIFKNTNANNAADFCLEMYKKLGLLDGIEVVRSTKIKKPAIAGFFILVDLTTSIPSSSPNFLYISRQKSAALLALVFLNISIRFFSPSPLIPLPLRERVG